MCGISSEATITGSEASYRLTVGDHHLEFDETNAVASLWVITTLRGFVD